MPTKQTREMKKTKSKNKSPESVTAAGGVLIRYISGKVVPEVLLIYRRGVWDLPKGKREENETIEECAVREVTEEIGISKLPDVVAPLIKTYHEYEQGNVWYGKTTHWYAMQLSSREETFTPEEKEGIEKVVWYPLDEAKKKVGYANLLDVLESLEQS